MKILFCSNLYEHVDNGPAKFANLVLQINTLFPQHQVKILTEDIAESNAEVFKLNFTISKPFRLLSQFKRMLSYHKRAMHIRKNTFHFDILVYNHAMIGLLSSVFFRNTIGLINDYNNSSATFLSIFHRREIQKFHIFHVSEFLTTIFAKKIIVNSEYMMKHINKVYPFSKNKIYLLYKPVELITSGEISNALNNNFSPLHNPPVILFVKSDYKRAGAILLIDALKLLKKKVKLIIVGPHSSKKFFFTQLIKESLIELKFLAKQDQKSVFSLLMESDIFCVPSYMEAFGVSNIEAMALGCAVVSTNVGGIPEVLDNGKCGWLVEPGNVHLLASAIEECLANDALRNQKKEYALKFIQKFNLHSSLKNFINILTA